MEKDEFEQEFKNDLMEQEVEILRNDVIKSEDGKYKKKKIYNRYISKNPETEEEKIDLFNIIVGNEEMTPFKKIMGKEITVKDIYMLPYDMVDPEDGSDKQGVKIVLHDINDDKYVTSSKTVYNTLEKLIEAFPIIENVYKLKIYEQENPQSSRPLVNVKLLGVIPR